MNPLNRKNTDPIIITDIHGYHTGICSPSVDNLVVTKTSSRIYSVQNKTAMLDLVKLIELNQGHIISARTIRALLQICTPNRKSNNQT